MKQLIASVFVLALSSLLGGCFRRAYGPAVYVQPQRVYVQPRPVYVQPQPVYVRPQNVYVAPPPVVQGSVVIQ